MGYIHKRKTGKIWVCTEQFMLFLSTGGRDIRTRIFRMLKGQTIMGTCDSTV